MPIHTAVGDCPKQAYLTPLNAKHSAKKRKPPSPARPLTAPARIGGAGAAAGGKVETELWTDKYAPKGTDVIGVVDGVQPCGDLWNVIAQPK